MKKVVIGEFSLLEGYVSREIWQTVCLLAADYGWGVMDCSDLPEDVRRLPATLRYRFGELPEVVLFRESYEWVVHCSPYLKEIGARLYVMTEDLHHRFAAMDAALHLATAVLSNYAPCLPLLLPEQRHTGVIWVPHGAGPDFQLPVEPSPEKAVFVSGAMDREFYPLRAAMRDLVARRPELGRIQDHPGYFCNFDYRSDPRVGRGYAEAIRQCLAAFTDAGRCRYVLAKHFEIPATGALLIAERSVSPQLASLGFVDGTHYLSADEDDLEAVVEHALDDRNRLEIDAIRRRGHDLVHGRHTTYHRAQEIDSVCV
jgi:hypothetical protein